MMMSPLAFLAEACHCFIWVIILTKVADNVWPLDFPTLLSLVEIRNILCRSFPVFYISTGRNRLCIL